VKTRAALIAILCLGLFVAAVLVGQSLSGPEGAFIVWQLRLPRVLVGALVGLVLGLIGAMAREKKPKPDATSPSKPA